MDDVLKRYLAGRNEDGDSINGMFATIGPVLDLAGEIVEDPRFMRAATEILAYKAVMETAGVDNHFATLFGMLGLAYGLGLIYGKEDAQLEG